MDEQIVANAMSIIMSAGDARVFCKEALNAIADSDFVTAKEKMKKSHEKITEAHRVQTDAIQGETRGEKSEYSLLFAHAQDTLMTVYSEINITKQMIKVFEKWDEKIKKLSE